MQIDLSRFRNTFFQEAEEHLADMETGLLRLEHESDPGLAERDLPWRALDQRR